MPATAALFSSGLGFFATKAAVLGGTMLAHVDPSTSSPILSTSCHKVVAYGASKAALTAKGSDAVASSEGFVRHLCTGSGSGFTSYLALDASGSSSHDVSFIFGQSTASVPPAAGHTPPPATHGGNLHIPGHGAAPSVAQTHGTAGGASSAPMAQAPQAPGTAATSPATPTSPTTVTVTRDFSHATGNGTLHHIVKTTTTTEDVLEPPVVVSLMFTAVRNVDSSTSKPQYDPQQLDRQHFRRQPAPYFGFRQWRRVQLSHQKERTARYTEFLIKSRTTKSADAHHAPRHLPPSFKGTLA